MIAWETVVRHHRQVRMMGRAMGHAEYELPPASLAVTESYSSGGGLNAASGCGTVRTSRPLIAPKSDGFVVYSGKSVCDRRCERGVDRSQRQAAARQPTASPLPPLVIDGESSTSPKPDACT